MPTTHSESDLLLGIIHHLLAAGNFTPIIQCMSVAKLSDEEFSDALQGGTFGEEVDYHAIATNLVEKLGARLQPESFKLKVENLPTRDLLLQTFQICCDQWLNEIAQLILNFEHNVAKIEKYSHVLLAKRTQTLTRDKWGDINHDAWNEVMVDFARDHFIGPDMSVFFSNALPEIQQHFLEIRAHHLSGRFVWLQLELLQVKGAAGSEDVGLNHQDGIEFERHIKNILERAVPTAVIQLTPASGDQGADLIFCTANAKVVIQAKRYSGTVGNGAVQEAYAAKGYYEGSAAVVVTNSTYSQSAKDLAARLDVLILHEDEIGPLFAKAFS